MPRRARNYRLLSSAQHFLIANDVRARKGGKHRTRVCHRNRQFGADTVIVRLSLSEAESAASLSGLQTCGSIWACPVCAPRIAAERGKEIQKALDWAGENGLVPVMVTLTARHTGEMTLEYIKSGVKAAWRFFTNRRGWRRFNARFGVEHWIAAREVLYAWQSGNGWHYHMHILLFIRLDALRDAIETDMQADLRPDWLAALAKHGLDAIGEYGLNVSAHGDVPGKYLAKLGLNPGDEVTDARYEISGAGNKQGRSGVNVWTLLERASRGGKDAKLAEKCYLEYITTMQGENWITWSHGFKALVGIDEQPDEQLAQQDDEPAANDWLHLSPEQWQPVAQSREYARLLMVAAETRSKDAVYSLIEALRDDLGESDGHTSLPEQSAAASGHTSPGQDERRCSFSSSAGPPIPQCTGNEIQQLLGRLSLWRANLAFVRGYIKAPEIRARQLALYNRMIADGEARLEALQNV